MAPEGDIAELLLPVGGAVEPVRADVPLEDDVAGLVHDDLVPLQGEAQVLLHVLAPGHVQHHAVDGLLAVGAGVDGAPGEEPHHPAVPPLDAVLQLQVGPLLPLGQLPEHVGPVLGGDELHELPPEPGAQLLPAVAAQLEKAGADAQEGEAGVGPALVHAAGDVVHQVLQLPAALLQAALRPVHPLPQPLLLPQGARPDIVLPPGLVPVRGGQVQMGQAHALSAPGAHHGHPPAQAGHIGPLHRPGGEPPGDQTHVLREGDGVQAGFGDQEGARVLPQLRPQGGLRRRTAPAGRHAAAAQPGHLRVHHGQQTGDVPLFQIHVLKGPGKGQGLPLQRLHGGPPPGPNSAGPWFFIHWEHYKRYPGDMEV